MSEYKKIEQQIKDLKTFLDYRFEENNKAHQEIIKHQSFSNGKIASNTEWRLKNQTFLEDILCERKNTRKQIKHILIQAIVTGGIAGVLVLLGASNL